jgi:dephospho-CoA kinase
VIDTDRIGWQLLRADTPVYRRVVRAFGPEILTGSGAIDRRALGRIVFRRKTELAKLNRIVHPALLAELRRRINAPDGITTKTPRHQEPRTVIRGPTDDGKRTTDDGQGARGRPILVVDAALLFFWGWQKHVDLAVLVAAPRNVKLRRLTKTGLTRAEARRRLKSQMPEARMRKLAHLVIENQGTRQELFAQCRKLWQLLRSGSSGRIDRR